MKITALVSLLLLSLTGCQPAVVGSGHHASDLCDVTYKIFNRPPNAERNTAHQTPDASLRSDAYELSVRPLNPVLRKNGYEVMTYLYASTFALADGFVHEKPSRDPGIDRASTMAFCLPDLMHTLQTTPAAAIDVSRKDIPHRARLTEFANFLVKSNPTRWTGWCKGYWIEATLTLNDDAMKKLRHLPTIAPATPPINQTR